MPPRQRTAPLQPSPSISRLDRRHRLLELLSTGRYGHLCDRGTQARLARALGVHRSTVCRDAKALIEEMRRNKECPLCGHWPD